MKRDCQAFVQSSLRVGWQRLSFDTSAQRTARGLLWQPPRSLAKASRSGGRGSEDQGTELPSLVGAWRWDSSWDLLPPNETNWLCCC